MRRNIRVGTRGSLLATQQARVTIGRLLLGECDFDVSLKVISTKGDVRQDLPLHRLGSTGLFVKEIEQALLSGAIDLAVHSLKDMPAALPEGLIIAGVLERADPRDALVSRYGSIADLPEGAIVGTSSLRRKSQLLRARPGTVVHDIRGNIDTRLAKLEAGEYDAVLLAACGLDRTGHGERIAERIDPSVILPAACQGIIAIETRADDKEMIALVRGIGDEETLRRAETERAFLASIEGGCRVPAGCLSVVDGDAVRIEGMIGSLDGATVIRRNVAGRIEARFALARELALRLLADGGTAIIEDGLD